MTLPSGSNTVEISLPAGTNVVDQVTVDEHDWLAHRFEAHRNELRVVAYRILGSGRSEP